MANYIWTGLVWDLSGWSSRLLGSTGFTSSFLYDRNKKLVQRWFSNPTRARTHVPRSFWSSYEYLIHLCQSEDSRTHQTIIKVPPLPPSPPNSCWMLSLEWFIIWAHNPISSTNMSFWCPLLDYQHLTTHHSHVGVRLRQVTNQTNQV